MYCIFGHIRRPFTALLDYGQMNQNHRVVEPVRGRSLLAGLGFDTDFQRTFIP